MTYEIIPSGHHWPAEFVPRAQSLVYGARGRPGELAGLSLLFRDPELTVFRAHVFDNYIRGFGGDDSRGRVEWATLYGAAMYCALDLTVQARALVMLACSMASTACPVRVGSLLGDLDEQTRGAFVGATTYLLGGTP